MNFLALPCHIQKIICTYVSTHCNIRKVNKELCRKLHTHKKLLNFQSNTDPYMSPDKINAYDNEQTMELLQHKYNIFIEKNPSLDTSHLILHLIDFTDTNDINEAETYLYLIKTTVVYYCLYLKQFVGEDIIDQVLLNYEKFKNSIKAT